MKKIGFIGVGNMGNAIIKGVIASGLVQPEDIYFYAYKPALYELEKQWGVKGVATEKELIEAVDTVLFGVKPNVLLSLLEKNRQYLKSEQVLLSIAAGVTLSALEAATSSQQKIIRIMPNTPALVGAGMASVSPNQNVSERELAEAVSLFGSFGKAEVVPEKLIDAVVGVSGSSPAYAYLFIEALADGAVLEGMPRKQAYEFAAQALLGAAKMVLETGQHPGELKDMVCSPGGTTIEAVKVLEEKGFRAAVIATVQAAAEKNRNM